MIKGYRIEIPMLPPKECSPNARVHWARKARAAKAYRTAANACALAASQLARPQWSKAELFITIIISDKRHIRDTDNAIASIKPAVDGCVDAGIIEDDNPECLIYRTPVLYQVDREIAPMTILEIKKVLE